MYLSFTLPSPSAKNILPQVPNPSVAALYEDALVYETGSAITSTGALTAYSGAKTGRSPLDKRIVKEPSSEKEIWWGYACPIRTSYCRGLNSDCSQACQQADDTRCKTTFPFSFTIPWSCTTVSLKSHDRCHSFYEITFQSFRPNGHHTSQPCAQLLLYNAQSFPFPRNSPQVDVTSFGCCVFANPAFSSEASA